MHLINLSQFAYPVQLYQSTHPVQSTFAIKIPTWECVSLPNNNVKDIYCEVFSIQFERSKNLSHS